MAKKSEQDLGIDAAPSVDEGQLAAEKQMRDIGAELYFEVRQYSRAELDLEREVVLRKIDWVIMPMVSCLFFGRMTVKTF
jgi:hypothetical protein